MLEGIEGENRKREESGDMEPWIDERVHRQSHAKSDMRIDRACTTGDPLPPTCPLLCPYEGHSSQEW